MYERGVTEASKSALLELGLALQQYHDDIVLTGGWAPYFITEGHFQHCGSVDIDLALKTEILPRYDKIREIIEGLGYVVENGSFFRFSRTIKSHFDGNDYTIELDMLCEREGTIYFNGLREVQEDLHACVFDGVSLAFDFNFEQEIETRLPGDGIDNTTIKVVDLVGSLALKGNALRGRNKEKDAYDIYALMHCDGGPLQAAKHFKQTVSAKKISASNEAFLQRSLATITSKFKDEGQRGPFQTETFSEMKYKRNIVAAQVNSFLTAIK